MLLETEARITGFVKGGMVVQNAPRSVIVVVLLGRSVFPLGAICDWLDQ